MSNLKTYRLEKLSVLDIRGEDADTIVNNVTTNTVKSLVDGEGSETFITDVRGKTLGHGFLFRLAGDFRFIGAPGQSTRISEHLDRYTIREDATPTVLDDQFQAWVLPPGVLSLMQIETPGGSEPALWTEKLGDLEVEIYRCRMLGDDTHLILAPAEQVDEIGRRLSEMVDERTDNTLAREGEAEFHHSRTLAGFPWYGIDLDDKNLPQEADRDAVAVSFTKGCYLGQETVARLDALGQVQRKLVRWSLSGSIPQPGATMQWDDKTVGRLTSVVEVDSGAIAIGFARRTHFDPGATAVGNVNSDSASPDDEGSFAGTVLG